MNVGQYKTANKIFNVFVNHFDFDFLIFFLVSASSENVF